MSRVWTKGSQKSFSITLTITEENATEPTAMVPIMAGMSTAFMSNSWNALLPLELVGGEGEFPRGKCSGPCGCEWTRSMKRARITQKIAAEIVCKTRRKEEKERKKGNTTAGFRWSTASCLCGILSRWTKIRWLSQANRMFSQYYLKTTFVWIAIPNLY